MTMNTENSNQNNNNVGHCHSHPSNNSNNNITYHYANATHCHVINPDNSNAYHHNHGGNGQRRQNSTSRFSSSPASSSSTSSPSFGSGASVAQSADGPLAIFTPCSNSHPFDERCISVTRSEEQAVKIGRAVVRFQPAANNAIFDCKVLSRNHAILWYNGEQFLIKDTRSSNGTFVNNERLSNSGEDSTPRALYSGDILQLGVEIVDNAKKVASGCVTCIVTLMDQRGEEFRRPPSSAASGATAAAATLAANGGAMVISPAHDGAAQSGGVTSIERLLLENEQLFLRYTLVPNNKLFIMDQYLKEARFRENALGVKLQSLEEQLAAAQEALESSWQALINEEHLLSRIEILESQLALYATTSKPQHQQQHSIASVGKPTLPKTHDTNADNTAANSSMATKAAENRINNCSTDDAIAKEMESTKNEQVKQQNETSCNEISAANKVVLPFSRSASKRLANEEIIRGEIREIYEDRAKAELVAKDALRKAEEEVFESTMRLHDVESSLLNVESENSLLRRQCNDYESELASQRVTLDGTLAEMARMRDTQETKRAEDITRFQSEIDSLKSQLSQKQADTERMAELLAEMTESDKKKALKSTEIEENSNLKMIKDEEDVASLREIAEQSKLKYKQPEESTNEKVNLDVHPIDLDHKKDASPQFTEFSPNNRLEKELRDDNLLSQDEKAVGDDEVNNEIEKKYSIAFIGEGRCECGRNVFLPHEFPHKHQYPDQQNSNVSSSASVQVLLLSTLPFLLLLIVLLLPFLNFWPQSSNVIPAASSVQRNNAVANTDDAIENSILSPSSSSSPIADSGTTLPTTSGANSALNEPGRSEF